jgi:hypothetical protein
MESRCPLHAPCPKSLVSFDSNREVQPSSQGAPVLRYHHRVMVEVRSVQLNEKISEAMGATYRCLGEAR